VVRDDRAVRGRLATHPPLAGAPWYGYERAAGDFSKPAANPYPMGSEDGEEFERGSEDGDVGELVLDSALEVYLQLSLLD
jgi:hypothetical protein